MSRESKSNVSCHRGKYDAKSSLDPELRFRASAKNDIAATNTKIDFGQKKTTRSNFVTKTTFEH